MCHFDEYKFSPEKLAELDEAIEQSRQDIAAGRYVIETAQEHVDGLIEELKKEA